MPVLSAHWCPDALKARAALLTPRPGLPSGVETTAAEFQSSFQIRRLGGAGTLPSTQVTHGPRVVRVGECRQPADKASGEFPSGDRVLCRPRGGRSGPGSTDPAAPAWAPRDGGAGGTPSQTGLSGSSEATPRHRRGAQGGGPPGRGASANDSCGPIKVLEIPGVGLTPLLPSDPPGPSRPQRAT